MKGGKEEGRGGEGRGRDSSDQCEIVCYAPEAYSNTVTLPISPHLNFTTSNSSSMERAVYRSGYLRRRSC